MYANKIDYMMDTNEATDIFSGNNKYQTIFISYYIISYIHNYNMSIWEIFGTEFTFSEDINNCK